MKKIKLKLDFDQAQMLHSMCIMTISKVNCKKGSFQEVAYYALAELTWYLAPMVVIYPRRFKTFSLTPSQAAAALMLLPGIDLSGPNDIWADNERRIIFETIRKQL
jgi:hypothetical protein